MAACGCADEYIEQILLSERLVLFSVVSCLPTW
jgi:hypothetical protein